MSEINTDTIPSPLETVRMQFERWRTHRKNRREQIPDELWSAAKSLTESYSINKVVKTLRLNYSDLKKRIAGKNHQPIIQNQSPSFIEFDLRPPLAQSECVIEMEDSSGAKMKMCFRGETNLDLLELGRAFWSKRQ